MELTRAYDRGRATRDEVETRLQEETSQIVKLQDQLGFQPVSDGALGWQDPLRPLTKSLAGVTFGTRYSRWFDTNTFYQKPVIAGKVSCGTLALDDFILTGLLPENGNWKVQVPGPYTFSELSENNYYANKNELVRDVARAEREIFEKLAAAKVSLIQLSEPSLVYRPYRQDHPSQVEINSALEAVGEAVKGVAAEACVHTFFGDPTSILPKLAELPVDLVGIDLYETDPTRIDDEVSKKLLLGIVDSRASHVEDPDWIAQTALLVRKGTRAPEIVLGPNSDLKFLPRAVADKKLSALSEGAKIARRHE